MMWSNLPGERSLKIRSWASFNSCYIWWLRGESLSAKQWAIIAPMAHTARYLSAVRWRFSHWYFRQSCSLYVLNLVPDGPLALISIREQRSLKRLLSFCIPETECSEHCNTETRTVLSVHPFSTAYWRPSIMGLWLQQTKQDFFKNYKARYSPLKVWVSPEVTSWLCMSGKPQMEATGSFDLTLWVACGCPVSIYISFPCPPQ